MCCIQKGNFGRRILQVLLSRPLTKAAYGTLSPLCLFQPVSCVVVGCDTIKQLEQNEALARAFEPMSKEEQEALIRETAPFACELMYYKP